MCEFELNKTWSKLKITFFCNRTFGPKIFYRNPNPEWCLYSKCQDLKAIFLILLPKPSDANLVLVIKLFVII